MGLLEQAAQELRSERRVDDAVYVEACLKLNPPKVLEAAETARKSLHAGWSSFLVKQFRIQRKDVSDESLEVARLLWHLGSNLLITTNFDNVLEWTLSQWPTVWKIESAHGHAEFIKGRHDEPTVWHLHGQIDEPDRLILTPDGYTRLYGSKVDETHYGAALAAFRQMLSSHTLVFVGFSLQDESVKAQLNWLEDTFKGQAGRHFALMRSTEIPLLTARAALQNIEPIAYAEHGEPLLAVLRQMAAVADPKSKKAPPDWPIDLGIEMPDSFMLRPENCIVPFHAFRHRLRQEVVDWALSKNLRGFAFRAVAVALAKHG